MSLARCNVDRTYIDSRGNKAIGWSNRPGGLIENVERLMESERDLVYVEIEVKESA